jgi:hypothetical protein
MNLKIALAALAVAFPLALGATAPAEAKTSVHIYFGVPHYGYRVGPDYVFRPGYGWYRRPGIGNRISCSRAGQIVFNKGYNHVRPRDCSGRTYVFSARRNGNPAIIYVNAYTGATWRG